MRDYGRVYATFWSSPTTAPLSDDGKLLALYLMTCSHNTIAGVFRLPDGYVIEDMGWQPERVSKGFAELFANGFAKRCEKTKWVWICKHLEWNPPDNPNQGKAVAKVLASVPDDCSWLAELNGYETVSKPQNNLPVPVPVPVKGGAGGKKLAEIPKPDETFEAFWAAYPSRRRVGKGACLKVWAKERLGAVAEQIVLHVEAMKLTPDWLKEDGKFVPMALTYLNQRRFDDGLPEAPRARLVI